MRVTIHDVRDVSAGAHSNGDTHWANIKIIDGGYGTQEVENDLVLFFPTAMDAFRFAASVNRARKPAPANFVVIETSQSPEPAA